MNPLSDYGIDYTVAVRTAGPEDLPELVEYLMDELPYRWIDSYWEMSTHDPDVLEVTDRGFKFLST
jgi:hypothetical protein